MKTCLVTGGTGFVGQHLVQYLRKCGYYVVVVSRKNNLDFTDIHAMRQLFEHYRFTYVFHLAYAGTLGNHIGTSELVETNIMGMYNFLNLVRYYHVRGLVNVGSSSEYGVCDGPVSEELALHPTFLFAGTKAAATALVTAMAHEYDQPFFTVRPFALYGPEDHGYRFVPTIIKAALGGKAVQVYPGIHDWIYVEDFVHAIVKLVKKAHRRKGEVFNIGTGIQTTNAGLVRCVGEVTGKKISITVMKRKMHTYDKHSWIADIAKLQSVIHWQPYSVLEGLTRTVVWYVKHPEECIE